jgi:hypothetical protein
MPVTSLFIDYFPGYDKFRAVSMTLVIAGVLVPLLAVLAVKALAEGTVTREKAVKSLMTAALVTGGIALIFFLFPGLAGSFLRPDEKSLPDSLSWLKEAMVDDRKTMLRADALRSVLLIAGGFVLLWFFLKDKIKLHYLLAGLTLLFIIDQIPVDARYLGSRNFETRRSSENTFAPTEADKAIMQDKDDFRVLNLTVSTFNDASTSYHHKSIGGYSGVKMKRYQELIESSLMDEINALITSLRTVSSWEEAEGVMKNLNALNMLNTRYIIIDPSALPLRNRYADGNAWLVNKVTIVENADAELEAIKTINPSDEAVIDRRFADFVTTTNTSGSPADTIFLTSYEPNLLTYTAELSADRVAVFSEIYYRYGWQAYVDDQPADHFRTDYVLRGMQLPAGNHTVTFRFEPRSYRIGNRVSFAGSVVLLALLALAAVRGFKAMRRDG